MITALTKDGKIIKQKKPVNYVFSINVPSPAKRQEYLIPYSYKDLLTEALNRDPETLNGLYIRTATIILQRGIENIENAMRTFDGLEKTKKNPSFLDPSLKNAKHALMNLKSILASRQAKNAKLKVKIKVK